MIEHVPDSWRPVLEPVLATTEARRLDAFLQEREAAGISVYPPRHARFRALDLTPRNGVKAVILGQDPYHGPGQANGLAFSVADGVKVPPSLRNILRELESDLGIAPPSHGMLDSWARRGVLLLNTSLTVEEGQAGSHAGKGWDAVADACLTCVAEQEEPAVFVLWGSHAQGRAARLPALQDAVAAGRHAVVESPHPSPLSAYRGFFGSRPFSRANAFLTAQGREPIDWRL